VAAALVIAYVLATRILAAGPRGAGIHSRHATAAHTIIDGRREFEKGHHLVVTPPVGTPVVLVADSRYLREYHGAAPGQQGTIVMHTQQTSGETGVLVDWGVRPNDMVRMDLSELKLAPQPESPTKAVACPKITAAAFCSAPTERART
jgi:hypothetical protein